MNHREQEYQRLIAPLEDRMIRTVWRIARDPQDAEDAFQDALLILWKRWDRIRLHPNPEALILHVTINAAVDVLRRRARQRRWTEPGAAAEEALDRAPSADQAMSIAEGTSELHRAIGLLSKNQAKAILMHVVEELPYCDVAAALHCGESTVRKHVARARARLRTLLSNLMPATRKEEKSHA
jgi:RNA polymerase sigma-70 factor (ECF subfamily)